jgi:hypothetical protein
LSRASHSTSSLGSIAWIRPLAQPYLKGYRALTEKRGSLRGYWFLRSAARPPHPKKSTKAQAGYFVGYLLAAEGFEYLAPQPPECVVFAFVAPVGSAGHRRLVHAPGSLLRKIFEYIRWLTHRPPRFVFHDAELAALTRHAAMRDWPAEKWEHLSRNFFIETLCWLVRSGLVRKLGES